MLWAANCGALLWAQRYGSRPLGSWAAALAPLDAFSGSARWDTCFNLLVLRMLRRACAVPHTNASTHPPWRDLRLQAPPILRPPPPLPAAVLDWTCGGPAAAPLAPPRQARPLSSELSRGRPSRRSPSALPCMRRTASSRLSTWPDRSSPSTLSLTRRAQKSTGDHSEKHSAALLQRHSFVYHVGCNCPQCAWSTRVAGHFRCSAPQPVLERDRQVRTPLRGSAAHLRGACRASPSSSLPLPCRHAPGSIVAAEQPCECTLIQERSECYPRATRVFLRR